MRWLAHRAFRAPRSLDNARDDVLVTSLPMSSNVLVVDAGNTNIVLGLFNGDDLVSSWRLATARERTADEYGILAQQLIGPLTKNVQLEGVMIASVAAPFIFFRRKGWLR